MTLTLKNMLIGSANFICADTVFRRLNKNKLLVVMYHGVTQSDYDPPVWTQLPVSVFRRQLEFLRKNYSFVTLSEVVDAIRNRCPLPERAALITFDDGYRNNYGVAFPLLRELGVPAAIFLTVDYIGSDEILWFDELYFLLQEAARRRIRLDLPVRPAREKLQAGRVWDCYEILAETLKRSGAETRTVEMERLRASVPLDKKPGLMNDFGMMSWDELREMQRSELIEFGVHTATHRILSELEEKEWEREILLPRVKLEQELETEIASFCFPNGRPLIDFSQEHRDYLLKSGYSCAFSTQNGIFDLRCDDRMAIGRIPAGNDPTSEPDYFALNTSGALRFAKNGLSVLRGNGYASRAL